MRSVYPRKAPCCENYWFAVFGLLVIHCALISWSAWAHSATRDEVGHLATGLSHWRLGTFGLYRVNPPLVRSVAALPLVFTAIDIEWDGFSEHPGSRNEFHCGDKLIAANGARYFWLLTLARWTCIPFSLIGGFLCYRWARELYGQPAGILALSLWCFSPNILAHGQLMTPDAGAAALGVAAAYVFWRWLKCLTWTQAVRAGIVLGLAELTKTTWIVLFGLWPLLWIVWRWPRAKAESEEPKAEGEWKREACQLGTILLLALYVLNLGYGFEGSFQKLGEYGFVSEALGGPSENSATSAGGRNRFHNTWLAQVPIPLPKNYLMGIDLQKWDFERKMWSYLRGEHRLGGWWYYYLYALAIKVPLAIWLLVFLAAGLGFFARGYTAGWRNELVLLAPIAVILVLVSSQTGFNHHLRYVLPIFPFAFIWISKVAQVFEFGHRKLAAVVVLAMAWSVGSSLWVYPHSLSYFNELAGGPKNGHAHLLNSNIDWGQDLLYLKRWLQKHPEAKPLHLAFSGSYDASIAGIEYTLPPTEPQPGWHALSVNEIRSRSKQYEHFLKFEPVAMAGYSIYIYHITPEEANSVRRELALPELPRLDNHGEQAEDEKADRSAKAAARKTGTECVSRRLRAMPKRTQPPYRGSG